MLSRTKIKQIFQLQSCKSAKNGNDRNNLKEDDEREYKDPSNARFHCRKVDDFSDYWWKLISFIGSPCIKYVYHFV